MSQTKTLSVSHHKCRQEQILPLSITHWVKQAQRVVNKNPF